MTKSKSLPNHAVRIHTYAELERFARAFAEGHLNLLIVCGPPGVGKSVCFRCFAPSLVCWLGGNASAFVVYQRAFAWRNRPIVLDDVDGLYRDRSGIRLLKQLCQSEKVKTLSWHTDAKTLVERDIPREFTTSSRVAIIANQWHSLGADTAALEDRGHLLVFEPGAAEVHRHAAGWFWDREIFDFVADHLHLIGSHSLRTYVLAAELKQAGLDWRQGILSRCLTGAALMVARLKADPSFDCEEERARAFVDSGTGCRATYFNHARTLQPGQALLVPRGTVSGRPPDAGPPLDDRARLRRRCGELGYLSIRPPRGS